MISYFLNAISNLYEMISKPVTATLDALTNRLQSVRDTITSVYKKTKEKLGYEQYEKLKDIIENEAEKDKVEYPKVASDGIEQTEDGRRVKLGEQTLFFLLFLNKSLSARQHGHYTAESYNRRRR